MNPTRDQNIIWIASYPKSGNTWVRAFLHNLLNELDGIWRQLTQSMERAKKTFADEGKSEDEVKAEYRKIAERRVRLGLLIGEIGRKAKVEVGEDELRRALIEEARRYPGEQRHVYEFYQKNPGALAGLS